MIFPHPLKEGDTVAILSPASRVKAEYVEGAAANLEAIGFRVRIMPHAIGEPCGSYAASEEARLCDFRDAWADPEVKAILCSRGGYGCVHLLEGLTDSLLQTTPKWLVGFSDVSALHARLQKAGIASIHGSMARYIAEDISVARTLKEMLCSPAPSFEYKVPSGGFYSRPGKARGRLKGGNFAVLSHLTGTASDIFAGEGDILFIEDISEAIYATERMLWQLHLTGALKRAAGLVIGAFTESSADANYPDTQSMIYDRLSQWGYLDKMPVAFNFPVGHIPENIPLIEGAEVELSCFGDYSILKAVSEK